MVLDHSQTDFFLNVDTYPHYNVDMKTIQITMDEKLLAQLDRTLKGRRRQRSAFIRESIAAQIRRQHIQLLEEREREAYRKHPFLAGEFDVDPNQLAWPEDWEDDGIWAKWGNK